MTGPTRGTGLLEGLLSRKRSDLARRLLEVASDADVLDIGCGRDPLFLKNLPVTGRYGIDRLVPAFPPAGSLRLVRADVGAVPRLPFKNGTFDAVTMLAVLEHLPARSVPALITDIHRVLKENGTLILTTPPPRTDRLLKVLATLRLVSPEEIDEHERAYTPHDLKGLFAAGPFGDGAVDIGTFELGMNVWARATKRGASQ